MKKSILFLTALCLPLAAMAAEIPFRNFPEKCGRAEVSFIFKKDESKAQNIFYVYSGKGDIFTLRTMRNRLQSAFYDRSEKKWYKSSANRLLPENKLCKVILNWEFPGRMDLLLDDKEAGGVTVDVPADFARNSRIFVGSNQVGKDKFAGEIRDLNFFSAKPATRQKKLNVNAEYVFELAIDETLKDLSGNGYHPLDTPVESKFAKGEVDAVRFASDGDGIQIPFGAFPGDSGVLEMVVNLEKENSGNETFYLLQMFSGKGDLFNITYRKNRLSSACYDRAEKKWYKTVPGVRLPLGKFVKITASWKFPGEIVIAVDGKEAGRVKVAGNLHFAPDTTIFIGSNNLKKEFFNGLIHSVKFFNTVQSTDKNVKKTIAESPVEVIKHRIGGITLGFDKKTLQLQSMVCGKVEYFSANNIQPWTMRIYDVKEKRYFDIDPQNTAQTSYLPGKDGIEFIWKGVALPDGSKFDVRGKVSAAGKDKLNWQLHTGVLPEKYTVDTVVYPRLPCRPTAKNPLDMYLCYPKYYGVNMPDAFNLKSKRERTFGSTYPGGAHYQFVYLYGKDVPGIFLHTDDKDGNYKNFMFQIMPKQKTLLIQLYQNPPQRAVSRQFVSQYPVYTAIMPGDWYDAAKVYRKWAVKQLWSAKGTLDKRKDLPEWVFDTHVATRPSCQTKGMTDVEKAAARVGINRSNFRIIRDELRCGGLAVWYSYYYADPGTVSVWKGASAKYNGRPEMKLVPGVDKAIAEFKTGKIYSIGFLNTRIYDESPDPDHADTKKVEPWVMRNLDGTFQRYANLPFDVCRIARPWQERLLEIIKHRVAVNGFDGMYLDSFGRGQYHCWAENHGHLPGSATASVAGQREMAKFIKSEMNKIVPGFVIASEANIEQFVDLIDFKLHHENIYEHAVPVWTKIYHDRQFVYGRNVNPARIQTTACFHIGALLGRIFTGNSDESLRKNYLSQEVIFYYRQLIAMRKRFYSQIGVGEMLRPPQVVSNVPDVVEKVNKKKFAYPAVTASAWRSSSGVTCAFFTNASSQNAKFTFTLDKNELPGIPKQWVLADNEGNLRTVPFDGSSTFELAPLSVAALTFGE